MKRAIGARRATLLGSASAAVVSLATLIGTPAAAITINDNFTPAQVVDTTNINGVGQMVVDSGGGFVGLCTATLINPRTVIFAAHCVNDGAANSYGAKFGGQPIGFGFQANDLPGLLSWLRAGPAQYRTNTSLAFYNSNYVTYNPRSLDIRLGNPPEGFLAGDVAMAALDTPASKIPTWTLLFSPLATPTGAPGASGTGYHVAITGYGTNGTGTTGQSGGIDYRRRSAENVLGLLGSLDDQDLFLFGAKDGLPQNLYQIDFDDPKRGTAAANPYDFNVFRDNALTREGITAPGDSGGPLIIDQAFSKPIVIGVLSGGDRFFNAQPGASYGTTAFYQPLYLFWDWIVANNPYRYVSAAAGDGKWTDATHWVNNLDPAYQVLGANGQPVNGLPTTVPAGVTGTTPKFGQVCFQDATSSDCQDLATGKETVSNTPIGKSGGANTDAGTLPGVTGGGVLTVAAPEAASALTTETGAATAGTEATAVAQTAPATGKIAGGAAIGADGSFLSATGSGVEGSFLAPTADGPEGSFVAPQDASSVDGSTVTPTAINTTGTPVPIPGLPGTTSPVPNNTDGSPSTGAPARYYDVTLSAAGTTTLDTRVTIDRLRVTGSAGLNIAATGALATEIDTTQTGGIVTVNGRLQSAGDYALLAGLLQGNGTLTAPFVTSAAGVIAPGTIGTIGRLTIEGDLVLSSGSQLAIDIGPNGQSDQLVLQTNFMSGNRGVASLGGALLFNPVNGYRPRFGDQFSFLFANGGIMGNFSMVNGFSAVLFPQLTIGATTVSARIAARPYASVIDANSPVQRAYAALLDANRPSYAAMSKLYGELDLLPLGDLRPTLENMAPHSETTRTSLARMQQDGLSRLYRERMRVARSNEASGTLAVIGQPLLLAQNDAQSGPGAPTPMATDAGRPMMAPVRLPEGLSAYIAGGYLDGDSKPMPSAFSAGFKDQLSGWYVAGGLEARTSPHLTLGGSFAYSQAFGQLRAVSRVDSDLYQVAAYGSYTLPMGVFVGAQGTVGAVRSTTKRAFQVNTVVYRLRGFDTSPAESLEINAGKDFRVFRGLTLTPTAALRYAHLEVGPLTETGGDAALAFGKRNFDSLEGRFGGELRGAYRSGGITIAPHLNANYVHDFADGKGDVPAAFFIGASGFTTFTGPGREKDWGEVGGGVTITGGPLELNLSADTNIGRTDLDYQSYRASIAYRF